MDDKTKQYKDKIDEIGGKIRSTGQVDAHALDLLREKLHKEGYFALHGYSFFMQSIVDINSGNVENLKIHIETLRVKKYAFIYSPVEKKKVRFTDSYSFIYKHLLHAMYHHFKTQDIALTNSHLRKALNLLKKIKEPDKYTHFILLHTSGQFLSKQGEYKKAKQYFLKSLKVDIPEFDELQKISIYGSLAAVEGCLGDTLNAIKHLLICEEYYHKHKFKLDYVDVCNNLGLLYLDSGLYNIALEYFQKTLRIVSKDKQNNPYITITNHLGLVYLRSKQYEKAEKYFCDAHEIAKQINNNRALISISINLAELYLLTDRPTLAENLLLNAIELINTQNAYINDLAQAYIMLAEVYLKQNNPSKAIKYIRKTNKLEAKLDKIQLKQKIYECYAEYYDALKQYKKALTYHKQAKELQEKIMNDKWEMANKILSI